MRRLGLTPGSAAEQVQHAQPSSQAFQSLPAAPGQPPYRMSSQALEIPAAGTKRLLHVIGDSGGIGDPNPQKAVAAALVADLKLYPDVGFLYHLGDIDYFNGVEAQYVPQFFEPYSTYNRHIVAIPGNHDGDPEEAGEASLGAFLRYFCDASPRLLPEVEEYSRDTMTQPNVYWTLQDELVTIIGLYTNVPAGGAVHLDQATWLAGECAAAPTDRALIVALHHPPYSCDAHHGGSQAMGTMLDEAFIAAQRWPELVLSGHVHNYQRFTRTVHPGHDCVYVVAGAGGYHNLHRMAPGAMVGRQPPAMGASSSYITNDTVLEAFEDRLWGFLRLSIDSKRIAGEYVAVYKDGIVLPARDLFTIERLPPSSRRSFFSRIA
jgi:hypothetical protein